MADTGILVPSGDVEAFFEGLLRAKEQLLPENAGVSARKRMQDHFSFEEAMRSYEAVYRNYRKESLCVEFS